LCDLPAPTDVDGKNFTPIINGNEKSIRESLFTVYRNTARAVRTEDWKIIRYPQRNYTQLFNLKNDPLEINNLATNSEYKYKVDEMMELIEEWHLSTNDTVNMNPSTILSLDYDYRKLKQKPDNKQPEYILKKYFKGVDLKNVKKSDH